MQFVDLSAPFSLQALHGAAVPAEYPASLIASTQFFAPGLIRPRPRSPAAARRRHAARPRHAARRHDAARSRHAARRHDAARSRHAARRHDAARSRHAARRHDAARPWHAARARGRRFPARRRSPALRRSRSRRPFPFRRAAGDASPPVPWRAAVPRADRVVAEKFLGALTGGGPERRQAAQQAVEDNSTRSHSSCPLKAVHI